MKKLLAQLLFGKPKDPTAPNVHKKIALVAFFAWIALGSDGLSSANYGPQSAFEALGAYPHLAVYLAIMISITVFIIALGYNQVIELFPNGGGGYKVANKLLHPYAGVLSGAALIIDYVLTIAISVSAASDALFSLMPADLYFANLYFKLFLVILLTLLNLRGMKESVIVLMPIFLGFVITHFALLVYGFFYRPHSMSEVLSNTISQSHTIITTSGWIFFLMFLLKAYSMGAGTYTGLEAVSNNVNVLAAPRVRTGKWTMFYMALSLSITAGGITLLYLLWHIKGVPNQTYNAVLFGSILGNGWLSHPLLVITLAFEAGILMLGANTGFLGGPAVLANMAQDRWLPVLFTNLSSRLVKQNGILFFGLGALLIVALFDGHVEVLVILYSTSVFLTFTISLFALLCHWCRQFGKARGSFRRLILSFVGFLVCLGILLITAIESFKQGAWLTLFVAAALMAISFYIKGYYKKIAVMMRTYEKVFSDTTPAEPSSTKTKLDPTLPTAVILVSEYRALTQHTLLNVLKMFPKRYKNVVFISAGVVDTKSFGGRSELEALKSKTKNELQYLTKYARSLGLNATSFSVYGTSPVKSFVSLIDKVHKKFGSCMYFTGKLISQNQGFLNRILDSEVAITIQNKLHLDGQTLLILPMKVGTEA